MLPYKNPELSPEERAKDLLSRMTLREKIAQMSLRTFVERNFDGEAFDKKYPNGLGATYDRSDEDEPLDPKMINKMQKHMLEETRLGIPMYMMSESLHGFMSTGATVYPCPLALGCTFDDELLGKFVSCIGKEVRSMGVHETYAPNLDLSKDPRWGRVEENYGEDPYLTSRMGVAYVKAIQAQGIAASPKHYVAHGTPEGGLNQSPVHAGERELRETMLKPFAAAFVEGKAMSVMPAYSELDGIPVHGSKFLCTDILRGELGFEGWAVSDWNAINRLMYKQHIAATPTEAGVRALKSGIDMEAPSLFGFNEEMAQLVEKGELDEKLIDQATYRVLLGKFKLGLFENPYADEDCQKKMNPPEAQEYALQAAKESCVLLKNDGILPLKANEKKIALIGPGCAVTQLGDYVPPYATVTASTVLDAFKKRLDDDKLTYVKGSHIAVADDGMIDEAVKACEAADVTVLVLADNSSFNGYKSWGDDNGTGKAKVTCGEGFDAASLDFPGTQQTLLEKIMDTGKPVVLLCMTGRPHALVEADEKCAAIMQVWYPGQAGGEAIAQLVFGEDNPSGRLSISFPRSVGHIPAFYNYKWGSRPDNIGGSYVFSPTAALYSFGHGLSYTKFAYSGIAVEQKGNIDFEVSVTVTNVGDRAGDEAVLMYIKDPVCSVTPFVKQLRGFKRVSLQSGESATVTFKVGFDDLSFINLDMKPEVEKGIFEAEIGDKSVQFKVTEV